MRKRGSVLVFTRSPLPGWVVCSEDFLVWSSQWLWMSIEAFVQSLLTFLLSSLHLRYTWQGVLQVIIINSVTGRDGWSLATVSVPLGFCRPLSIAPCPFSPHEPCPRFTDSQWALGSCSFNCPCRLVLVILMLQGVSSQDQSGSDYQGCQQVRDLCTGIMIMISF